jgi:DNA polymerase-3 subunit beta
VRFELDTTAFADAAGFAARHVPRIPALPALAGLLLSAEPGVGVTITGSDIEAWSTATVPAEVTEAGRLLLPGRPVADVLRALPPGPATVEATEDAFRLQTDIVDFSFPTMRLEDYPEPPEQPTSAGTVAGAQLRRAAAQVATVTSRDAVPPVLSAIRVQLGPDELRLAGTDRYRLAFRSVDWSSSAAGSARGLTPHGGADTTTILVPGQLFAAAASGLDADTDWTVGCDAGHISVADGARRTIVRLFDGAYPEVERYVPTEFSCVLRADRDELATAVRRVSLADEQRGHGAVVLDVGSDLVRVEGGSGHSRGKQRLPGIAEGEPLRVAFTVSYLTQALQSLDGETAQLSMNPGVGKVLVTAAGIDSYRHIVMSRQLPG